MTISNGNTITADDLNGEFDNRLPTFKGNNYGSGVPYQLNFRFDGVTDTTALALRSAVFTIPDDCELREVAAKVVRTAGSGVYTITISGPLVETITISDTVSADPTNITRYYDTANNSPRQMLYGGGEYTLTVSTTNTDTSLPKMIQVNIYLVSGRRKP